MRDLLRTGHQRAAAGAGGPGMRPKNRLAAVCGRGNSGADSGAGKGNGTGVCVHFGALPAGESPAGSAPLCTGALGSEAGCVQFVHSGDVHAGADGVSHAGTGGGVPGDGAGHGGGFVGDSKRCLCGIRSVDREPDPVVCHPDSSQAALFALSAGAFHLKRKLIE